MNRIDVAATVDVEQLELKLQGKLGGRIHSLQLLLQDCGLILRGLARTYHAKQLAQHALMMETNLPLLANDIDVC